MTPNTDQQQSHEPAATGTPRGRRSRRAALTTVATLVLSLQLAAAAYAEIPGRGFLPNDRGWEKVSPTDKNGADIESDSVYEHALATRAADSGQGVAYNSAATFVGASGAPYSQYLSSRGPAGWTTTGMNPPYQSFADAGNYVDYQWISADLSLAAVSALADITGAETAPFNLYLRDNATGSYQLVFHPAITLPPMHPLTADGVFKMASNRFLGASQDGSRVVFESSARLTPDAPPEADGQNYVYEWNGGPVRLMSVLPDGQPAIGDLEAGGNGGISGGEENYPGDHAVSDDGSRVFFTAPPSGVGSLKQVYVRQNGLSTTLVSASERTDCADDPQSCMGAPAPDPAGRLSAIFQSANPQGTVALFLSGEKLTDESTATALRPSLYRWDASAPEGERLTDMTTTDPAGAEVLGVVGTSEDATRVYFVGRGALAVGAAAGAPNLYLWQAGTGIRHVATLDDTPTGHGDKVRDQGAWTYSRTPYFTPATGIPEPRYREARVTPDGEHIAFVSYASLTGYPTAGNRQLYLYDVDDDELTCVSCNPRAASSAADAAFQTHVVAETQQGTDVRAPGPPLFLVRNLSDDGGRVFFESGEALVERDLNGEIDVYQWEDGHVSLISSGRGAERSAFVDADTSGDNVFFTTRDQLVRDDQDVLIDMYVARAGGGFDEPPLPPACAGDECQGQPSKRPGLAQPVTGATGAGDAQLRPRPSLSIRRLPRSARRRLASGRQAVLRVRVNRAGRVALRGRARIGKRHRVIARASRRAHREGTLHVPLKLSKQARGRLARGHRLRVAISVSFTGALEPATLRVTLTRPGKRPTAA